MNEGQVMHAMCIDDMYHVDRTLAQGPGGATELVSIGPTGPFVRKKIPTQLAHRRVWAALPECGSPRLPNVETTYELPDCFVVVYDYVPGETLEDRVQGKGRLDEAETTRLTSQICEAVQALHEHGIFHRDLSPTNVVIAADGAHLIDLGIARMHRENCSRDTTPLGTYGFAAPEQYGFAQSDERTDVYSIGRLLGYMLTGEKPHEETSAYDDALADESRVPARLRRVAQRACAFEPSARYQSAADLARALAGEEPDEGTSAPQSDKVGRVGSEHGGQPAPVETPDTRGGASGSDAHKASTDQVHATKATSEGRHSEQGRGRGTTVAIVLLAALSLTLGAGWFLSTQQGPQTGTTSESPAMDSPTGDAGQEGADSSTNAQETSDDAPQDADETDTDGPSDTNETDAPSSTNDQDEDEVPADEPAASDQVGESAGTGSSKVSSGTGETSKSSAASDTAATSAPAASGTAPTSATSQNDDDLRLGETLWAMSSNGYMTVAVEFVNASTTEAYSLPQVNIVARAQDGTVLASKDDGTFLVNPGTSSWYWSFIYVGEEPASVDFTLNASSPATRATTCKTVPVYSVDNVRLSTTSSLDYCRVTGDVTCLQDGSLSANQIILTLILRDKDGGFVGAYAETITRPEQGQSQAFTIDAPYTLPEGGSYEIYVQER